MFLAAPVPIVEPECRIDPDCPQDHSCHREKCKPLCERNGPCQGNLVCSVIEDKYSGQRSVSCSCPPGLIEVAPGRCESGNSYSSIAKVSFPITFSRSATGSWMQAWPWLLVWRDMSRRQLSNRMSFCFVRNQHRMQINWPRRRVSMLTRFHRQPRNRLQSATYVDVSRFTY